MTEIPLSSKEFPEVCLAAVPGYVSVVDSNSIQTLKRKLVHVGQKLLQGDYTFNLKGDSMVVRGSERAKAVFGIYTSARFIRFLRGIISRCESFKGTKSQTFMCLKIAYVSLTIILGISCGLRIAEVANMMFCSFEKGFICLQF